MREMTAGTTRRWLAALAIGGVGALAAACDEEAPTVGCTTNTECATSAKGPVCDPLTKACVGCVGNNDCIGNPKGTVCDTATKTCVGCTTNTDCAMSSLGAVCDTAKKVCVICTADSNCPMGQKCNTATAKCVQCLGNKDCMAGNVCQDGYCRTGCGQTDSSCPTGKVCLEGSGAGVCVDCVKSSDCMGDAKKCDTATHTCVACLTDPDCMPGLVCRNQTCQSGCTSSQPCPMGQVCDVSIGACVECVKDGDCKTDAAPRCDVKTNKCVQCLPGSTDNCAVGKYCVGTSCVDGCRNDIDCQGVSGKPKCLIASHSCVGCINPVDCPAESVCGKDNTCTSGCVNDSGCTGGRACCSSQCARLDTTTNCGACGKACGKDESCCNGKCTSIATVLNCGSCGSPCAAGQTCCGGACVAATTDVKNCGTCGNACKSGETCCAGLCKDASAQSLCLGCDKTCNQIAVGVPEFKKGTASQLVVDDAKGLATVPGSMNPPIQKSPHIWIAAHNTNQVNKLDVNTGDLLGTYATGGGNPSRGAMHLDGSFWIGHRGQNCNVNDPSCSNVSNINVDGTIRCTVKYSADGQVMPFVRGLAIDKNGYVWAGSWNDARLHKIDPNTCKTVLDIPMNKNGTGTNPYGLVIDSKGIMWNSTGGGGTTMGVNTATGQIDYVVGLGYCGYGITADKKDNIYWGSDCTCAGGIVRMDGVTRAFTHINGNNGRCGYGATIDTDGNLWVAQPSSTSCASKFAGGTGAFIGSWCYGDVSNGYGIAGDALGYVWYPGVSNDRVVRIKASDGSQTLSKQLGGNYPYSYSDWTGLVMRTVTTNNAQAGTWLQGFDAGKAADWQTATWTADAPKGTTVKMRFKAAATAAGLQTATNTCGPFTASPADLTTCNFGLKQWLGVTVELTTSDMNVQPSVSNLTLYYQY